MCKPNCKFRESCGTVRYCQLDRELCSGCEGYTQPNGCVGEVIDGKCNYFKSDEENCPF
jgi:hypothetical protein